MINKNVKLIGHQLQILRWLYFFTLRDLEIAPYLLTEDFQPVQHNVVDKNKFGIQILSEGFDEEEVARDSKDEDLAIIFFVEPDGVDSMACNVNGKCVDDRLEGYFNKLWDALLIKFKSVD